MVVPLTLLILCKANLYRPAIGQEVIQSNHRKGVSKLWTIHMKYKTNEQFWQLPLSIVDVVCKGFRI